MSRSLRSATAFAPATVANVAVGFDILGFAMPAVGDRVTVTRLPERTVRLTAAHGVVTDLPSVATRNTATAPLVRLLDERMLDFGFAVEVDKGIALGSGMGGSAASAVAAVLAASALLDTPLAREELLDYALTGEAAASGARHADNVAPCLYGGLVLVRGQGDTTPEVVPLPMPRGLECVLVHPHLRLDTREARAVLRREVTLAEHVAQAANLGAFVAACFQGDRALLKRSFEDVLIEPQRARLIPGFAAVKAAALATGALGCSISGSGPSVFAWVDATAGVAVRDAMVAAFADHDVAADAWITPLAGPGAELCG